MKIILQKWKKSVSAVKSRKEKVSLEEKFAKYSGKNLAKDFIWDNPKGKEIW